MYIVRDGASNLKFDGEKLAESSSRSFGRTRWVEFQLYRTTGGQYVLSRVGVSLYYHVAQCSVVSRNKIKPVLVENLPAGMVACETCSPVPSQAEQLYPETPRYWAQVSDTARGVVEALYKYDDDSNRYLTNVARQLLTTAARIDVDVYDAFYEQVIP